MHNGSELTYRNNTGKTALCISQFQLVLPQLLVLLSHKRVANLSKHYELLCTLPPKKNIFFLGKMYTATAIDHNG